MSPIANTVWGQASPALREIPKRRVDQVTGRGSVTGQATGKVLNFLNLDSIMEGLDDVHVNVSGYSQNRILRRLMTDELVVRKVKNMVKATPLYAGSKRIYRKLMKANLKKTDMAPQTRQVLKEKFQDDVALLAEYTGLPIRKFWTDFQ